MVIGKQSGNSLLPVFSKVRVASRRVAYFFFTSTTKHVFNKIVSEFKMDKVINLGIPDVGELIFESISTPGLIKCLEVSLQRIQNPKLLK